MEQKYPDDALHNAFWKKGCLHIAAFDLQTRVEIGSAESLGQDASMGMIVSYQGRSDT